MNLAREFLQLPFRIPKEGSCLVTEVTWRARFSISACSCVWGHRGVYSLHLWVSPVFPPERTMLWRLGMFLKNWGWFQSTITLLAQIKHDISHYSTSRRNFYIVFKTPESLQPSAGSQLLWNTSCSEEQSLVKRMKCLSPHLNFFFPRSDFPLSCFAAFQWAEQIKLLHHEQ